jgi:hypothetical protein
LAELGIEGRCSGLWWRGQLVARLIRRQLGGVLSADALDSVVRCLEILIRQQQDLNALALLDLQDAPALFVEQEGGDADG